MPHPLFDRRARWISASFAEKMVPVYVVYYFSASNDRILDYCIAAKPLLFK